MVLNFIMGLKNQATNFRNAFAQAKLKQPVYLQPLSKESYSSWFQNPILRLNKILYGQAEAPRLWYDKLKEGLEKRGFTIIKVEPCMFISKTVICVQ